jgi:small subunit ribosomal protein S14
MALIERELKRDKLVAKYAKKHAELKAIARDPKRATKSAQRPAWRCKSFRATRTPRASATVAKSPAAPRYVPPVRSGARKIREMAFAGISPAWSRPAGKPGRRD